MKRYRNRAFTLIELLLVLAILAILIGIIAPRFTNRAAQARITAAKTDISNLESVLNTFEVDTGRYPTSDEGLAALLDAPANVKNWHGPYVNKLPNDPWGNAYQYVYPGTRARSGFDLFSYGPDGHEGGDDDIANWD